MKTAIQLKEENKKLRHLIRDLKNENAMCERYVKDLIEENRISEAKLISADLLIKEMRESSSFWKNYAEQIRNMFADDNSGEEWKNNVTYQSSSSIKTSETNFNRLSKSELERIAFDPKSSEEDSRKALEKLNQLKN